tara:strand:+ start:341 stop:517 length:177 start_codon:yes stop_codon:yes gene_type:complete
MKPSEIGLESVSKNFEYERLSREIESCNDVKELKEMLKCYIKLYLKQQEVVSQIGLIE